MRTLVALATEHHKTVYVAVGANIVIGIAKGVAGALTGSSAMLAEAAHSAADTMNEVFMLVSLRLGKRKPDSEHPFGYGKERFFWAFIAAVFILVASASFSIAKGIHEIMTSNSHDVNPSWFVASYVVLGVAFIAEGTSFLRARRQMGRQAKRARMRMLRFVWESKDPTPKVVLLEDFAAMVGVTIAAAGVALYQITGNSLFDGVASILIGLLLAGMAIGLGADTKGLLVGEAALPEDRKRIERVISGHDGVEKVMQILTMAMGPESLLVAARIHLRSGLSATQVEKISYEIDCELRERVPSVRQVFLDPTSHREPKDDGEPAKAPAE